MTEIRVPDHSSRERALDPSHSFICEAPAGSGKTELLTQRFLTLLSRVDKPEEVLAITFTRKAAAEMRHRVIESLRRAVAGVSAENEHQGLTLALANAVIEIDRRKEWHLIESPSRLQIKTFDGLCASLANSLPIHASFSGPPKVTEDAHDLFVSAVRTFVASLEEDVPWADSLATVMALLDNNAERVEKLLINMLSKREYWLPVLGRGADGREVISVLQHNLQVVRKESVDKVKQSISPDQQRQLIALAAFAANNLAREGIASPIQYCADIDLMLSELPDASDDSEAHWAGITTLLLSKTDNWRKKLDVRCGFPAKGETTSESTRLREKKAQCLSLINDFSTQIELHSHLCDVRYMPSAKYDEAQKQLLTALIQVLPIACAYLSVKFREENCVDFTEVSMRAVQALGALDSPSDLALNLDYKIQHILVDEFQDTSPSQLELVTRLTAGWEPSDGRTLFCVGDAMQSIYGFRNSNVGLFLQCMEHGVGELPLTPLRLTTNFRSQMGIVAWINSVFSSAFPRQNDIDSSAVAYSDSVAFQTEDDGDAVQVHGLSDGCDPDDEAHIILDIIRKTRQDKPESTIAILVRNRAHAMHITPLLEREAIAYQAVALEPLSDNMLIQDLMALTHALLNCADRIAWLSVLRAPWCGMSLEDLEIIVNTEIPGQSKVTIFQQLTFLHDRLDQRPTSIMIPHYEAVQADLFAGEKIPDENRNTTKLSVDGQLRLRRVAPVLQKVFTESQRKPLRQFIEGLWLALGGPACLKDQREAKNATLFFSVLEDLDRIAILNKQDALQKAVSRLFALPDPKSDGKLQIMTIHKAKGLEFDTVIVPSLHSRPRHKDPELLRWQERLSAARERHLIMSPITSSGKTKDSIYTFLETMEKRRELNETCRLLYVACTRARQKLHLLATVKPDEKKPEAFKLPTKGSLLSTIWSPVKKYVKLYEKSPTDSDVHDLVVEQTSIRRLHNNWQMPVLAEGNLLASYVPFYEHQNQVARSAMLEDYMPRVVGTFVHQLLQSLDEAILNRWKKHGVEEYRVVWRSHLRNFSLPATQLDEATAKILLTMQCLIRDHSIHWIFSSSLPLRDCEFSISLPSSNGSSQLVVDLLIFDGNNTWIVDYKTSQPEPDEALDKFLAREQSRYRDIMSQYKKAVENMGYESVKLALYFPMVNRWCEYP